MEQIIDPSGESSARAPTERTAIRLGMPPVAGTLLWLQILAIGAFIVVYPLAMVSDDTYFYFQIARNVVAGHGSMFHGYTPTNGYHPLWLVLVTGLRFLGRDDALLPHLVMGLVLIVSVASFFAAISLARRLDLKFGYLALAVLVPYSLFTQIGSESNVAVLFVVLSLLSFARFLEEDRTGEFVSLHLFLSLSVLARLDQVFVAGLIGLASAIVVLRRHGLGSAALRRLGGAGAVDVLLLGGYLLVNLLHTGHFEPISGAIKASGDTTGSIVEKIPTMALAALAPIAASLLALLTIDRDRVRRLVLIPLYAGVLIHAAYIIRFMSGTTLWTWYYAAWMVAAALALPHATEVVMSRLSAIRGFRLHRLVAGAASCLPWISVLLPATWFAIQLPGRIAERDGGWVHGYTEPFLKNLKRGDGVLVFDYPGALAYFTQLHVLAADGLTSDYRFQRDIRDVGIEAYMAKRNIRYFMAPGPRLDRQARRQFCGRLIHQAIRLDCRGNADGSANVVGATVYAALYGQPVGTLALRLERMAFVIPRMGFAVWRVDDADDAHPDDRSRDR